MNGSPSECSSIWGKCKSRQSAFTNIHHGGIHLVERLLTNSQRTRRRAADRIFNLSTSQKYTTRLRLIIQIVFDQVTSNDQMRYVCYVDQISLILINSTFDQMKIRSIQSLSAALFHWHFSSLFCLSLLFLRGSAACLFLLYRFCFLLSLKLCSIE